MTVHSAPSSKHRDQSADLYLLGAGIAFPQHLTIETIEALTASAVICTNLPASRVAGLPEDLKAKCQDLWALYKDGRVRTENYRDVANGVVRAIEKGGPVAWLTPGHPLMFDSVSERLLSTSRVRGWKVIVLPAVSCLDTILIEVNYDPAHGLVVHEASAVVRHKIPLVPSMATILLQPSVFLSDRAALTLEGKDVDLLPLQNYLLGYYPDNHECVFVRSASEDHRTGGILRCTIGRISGLHLKDFAGGSLFIPRASGLTGLNDIGMGSRP